MRHYYLIVLGAFACVVGCAFPVQAQDSIADRLDQLEAELVELRELEQALEDEITTLQAILSGGGAAILEARESDEKYEFNSYPVYHTQPAGRAVRLYFDCIEKPREAPDGNN